MSAMSAFTEESFSGMPAYAGSAGVGTGDDRQDPASRGRLVMASRVVEKIAAQAASEVSVAGGRSGGVLGIGARTDLSARPQVEVQLSGGVATIAVRVGVAYPMSLREATAEVRSHVVRRVETLTGVEVRRVDIDVAWLTSESQDTKRRIR